MKEGRMDYEVEVNPLSLQAAIDAAEAGTVISVAPGTYYENVTVPADLQITIEGA